MNPPKPTPPSPPQTLSDPGKRSVYNDMAGFSESAVNPFLDAAAERDQVGVTAGTDPSVCSRRAS